MEIETIKKIDENIITEVTTITKVINIDELLYQKEQKELQIIDYDKKIKRLESKLDLIDDEELLVIFQENIDKLKFEQSLYQIDIMEINKQLN